MSVYSTKGKGWRYDFVLDGQRHSAAGFKTQREARQAEARRREELKRAQDQPEMTDMGFLELVNLRLDHVKAYNSERHYKEYVYCGKRWIRRWGSLPCLELSPGMIQSFLLERRRVSPYTANKELRYLRATFNFGKKWRFLVVDPTEGIEFFPVDKAEKYIPPLEDIEKVIHTATPDDQDYLRTIQETLARVSEVNSLRWDDVDFANRTVTLYTRKKKGGHRTPRRIPMTMRLLSILTRRFEAKERSIPWVFWHRYWSNKQGEFVIGPYKDRKRLMGNLCAKAGVRYFRYHALRHAGASLMDSGNIPVGAIQRILGHENRKTTEIYLHSMGEVERMAMQTFESLRQAKVPHQVPHQRKRGHADVA